ncbi:MAG: YaiI/YqxD family protein [Paracoccus sp. (in: a-proteobacteria)]|nr:YaiI/YqxD family protein [Paracoccus sp. (in: a-proteobacteria)]
MTTIFVDADACPVKAEAERVAIRRGIPMVLVCNGGLRLPVHPLIRLQIVAEGPDMADIWIADHCNPGDVIVTGDLPLADRCIKAGAHVVTHAGEELTAVNIGPRLAVRDLMADIRGADPFHQGRSNSFGKTERARFLATLDRVLGAARLAS